MTIYDFPTDRPDSDVDNIIKLIQDALTTRVYVDDKQIKRVVAQRFLEDDLEFYGELPKLVSAALVNDRPFVYVYINNAPLEDAV